MSNLDKLIKEDYTTLDSLRALYVSGTNNIWETIKSGDELRETKNLVIHDNVINSEVEI